MAKTNYNKVEDAFDKGVFHLKVDNLLRLADEAQGVVKKEENEGQVHTPKQMMMLIELDLKRMFKEEPNVYKLLNIKRKRVEELIKLVNTPGVKTKLKKEELDEISQIRERIDILKKTRYTPTNNEAQIEEEMGRHVYKRHNLREKWLPLDTHADWNKYKKKWRR